MKSSIVEKLKAKFEKMKHLNSTMVFIIPFFLLFACNDNSEITNIEINPEPEFELNTDCEFVENEDTTDGLMDETERNIIRDCRESPLTSNSAIENNLIGEWELIGFVDGWHHDVTQPCGYIKITKDELIFDFKDEYIDSVFVHQWEIENLWLKVDPENPLLSMFTFCDQFMYGSYSDFGSYALDVDQYIYKKVE